VNDDQLAHLYRTYAPVIYARCRRILKDERAAEDATQETFVRVHRHLAKAPDPQHALRWIYRIATNYCLNELRDRVARPTPVDDVEERLGGEEGGVLDGMIDRDLVVRLLARVPAETGEIAWLHHVDGLDQSEVGELLGISRRTVVNRLANLKQVAHLYLRRTAV
jgi:RNA polymerase sigma-70 factor, ECF subfamily